MENAVTQAYEGARGASALVDAAATFAAPVGIGVGVENGSFPPQSKTKRARAFEIAKDAFDAMPVGEPRALHEAAQDADTIGDIRAGGACVE